jgi:hypothetical protein
MHRIEPFDRWREWYAAECDARSPFYQRNYSADLCSQTIYNYYIHPQWDEIGSSTLFAKLLFADYVNQFCIIELLGEWNDILHNDIMHLYQEMIEILQKEGIRKFILLGEHVLIFHPDSDDYYQLWAEENEDGWIAGINFRPHIIQDIKKAGLAYYINTGGALNSMEWRRLNPIQIFRAVNSIIKQSLS